MPTANVRHEIAADVVAGIIARAIAGHEDRRATMKDDAAKALAAYEAKPWSGRAPKGAAGVDPLVDSWIATERDRYAHVRVIELPQDGKRFILVYGDADDSTVKSGTGPFSTFAEAEKWFLEGGR